jgi:hypothetical protein
MNGCCVSLGRMKSGCRLSGVVCHTLYVCGAPRQTASEIGNAASAAGEVPSWIHGPQYSSTVGTCTCTIPMPCTRHLFMSHQCNEPRRNKSSEAVVAYPCAMVHFSSLPPSIPDIPDRPRLGGTQRCCRGFLRRCATTNHVFETYGTSHHWIS